MPACTTRLPPPALLTSKPGGGPKGPQACTGVLQDQVNCPSGLSDMETIITLVIVATIKYHMTL